MTIRATVRAWSLGVGVAAGSGLASAQPPVIPPADSPPVPIRPATPTAPASPAVATVAPAAVPAVAPFPQMLADAKVAYARMRDYVCHYVRQEKVAGRLVPEQKCELRVRTQPFAASVKVASPREYAGRETLYAGAKTGGKVQLLEPGKPGPKTLKQDDPRVLADTRHTLADTGLLAVLERVERAVAVETRLGHPVQVLTDEYKFAGRVCDRYEVFCERPHALRYAARHVLYVDKETRLPVRYEAYEQPVPGGTPGGELIEAQSFVGLKANQGFGDTAFEK